MTLAHGGHHHHDHHHRQGYAGRSGSFRAASHDAADSLDSALQSSAAGIRAVKISLLVLGATALAQIVIVVMSGSIALAADTIHNFSDALTAVPLWIAFALSTKAATRRYTYGFGKVEDLAGLFVVAMITLSAIVAGYEAIDDSSTRDRSRMSAGSPSRVWPGSSVTSGSRSTASGSVGRSARRPGRRRPTCPHRWVHLPGGVARCRWCRAGLPAGRPDHRSGHHSGNPGRLAYRSARHLPSTHGRGRPKAR